MRNEKDEGSLGRVAHWDDSTQASLFFSLPLASRRVLVRLEQEMSKSRVSYLKCGAFLARY